MTTLSMQFGALAPSIAKQLTDAGFTAPPERVELWQRMADAITLLRLHSLLPDSAVETTRKKLLKKIAQLSKQNQVTP